MKDVGLQTIQTQELYDRIALLHNLTFKINGYRRAVERYLRMAKLPIDSESLVLDAGCGTGMMTLSLYSANYNPKKTVAYDLSAESLDLAKKEFKNDKFVKGKNVSYVKGNVLSFPFEDESFDLILSAGVLEYVSLDEGLKEFSRVLRKGGYLVFTPIFPSPVSKVLELIYQFKLHSPRKVDKFARKYFHVIHKYNFPPIEPISWTHKLVLAQKV